MKQGWEYKKLGELSSFIGDGDWIESKDQSTNGIRLIQTGNIGNGVYKSKEDKPHYISERTFEDLGCTEIFEGDCLVSRLPDPVGRACLIPKLPFRAITAVDCTIIRFNERVLSKYFVYYTQSTPYSKRVYLRTTGSTRKRISRKNLEAIEIPLPPLSQQQSIVAELDKINEIIDLKKAQLKDLDLLAQSIFYDMFGDPIENPKGWEVKKLEDVSTIINGFAFPSSSFNDNNPLKAIKITNVGVDEFVRDSASLPNEYQNKTDFVVKQGDIVIALTRTVISTGLKRALVPKDYDGALLNQRVASLKHKNIVNKEYLYYFLGTKFVMNYVLEHARANMQPNLSIGDLRRLPIPLPPLSLQQSFAEKIQAIESQKSAIKQSLAEAETLLASRMDYWFN